LRKKITAALIFKWAKQIKAIHRASTLSSAKDLFILKLTKKAAEIFIGSFLRETSCRFDLIH
jgi:hypothetical protein